MSGYRYTIGHRDVSKDEYDRHMAAQRAWPPPAQPPAPPARSALQAAIDRETARLLAERQQARLQHLTEEQLLAADVARTRAWAEKMNRNGKRK